MGEAKRRGTREERIIQAENERLRIAQAEQEKRDAKRDMVLRAYEIMTAKQRELSDARYRAKKLTEHGARRLIAEMFGMDIASAFKR
jgi:hypothetical protein